MTEITRPNRVTDRVLIIGLDGATFDVLDPLMDRGVMPTLKQLVAAGASGVLHSTKPPITPAAWTTFMTGKGPGRHGVIDFERYDPKANCTELNSTFQIKEKTIWQILGDNGLRTGSIHLPMTYPPQPVNGFVISGFETPSIDADFTYPAGLKRRILDAIPDYTYSTNWRGGSWREASKFAENLAYFKRNFRQSVQLARLCTAEYGWDLMMVLFKLVDNIQHKCWKYLTSEADRQYPTQQRMVHSCFHVLDECLAELVELAQEHKAAVVIMSDHGHGSLDGSAQPNLMLKQWGYLNLISPVSQAKTRAKHGWYRLRKKRGSRFAQPNLGIEHDLAIDWGRTRACVMHAGIYGFLYLNMKGRQPGGTIEPGDYDAVRDELVGRFGEARDETFGRPVFEEVLKPEEVYHCQMNGRDLPDLMLVPATGLRVVRKIRGAKVVKWARQGRLGGTHRVEGIFAIHSPHVVPGVRRSAQIADITPTVLAMLGVPVPADMEGKVLADVFDPALKVAFEPPKEFQAAETPDQVYSEQEQKMLTERLSDLGYLE